MGNIILGNAGHDKVVEFNTTACVHCRAVIIQETHYVGGRPIRITVSLSNVGGRIQEVDEGYYCNKCGGEACPSCGIKALQGLGDGPCRQEDKIYNLIVARS